MSKPKKGVMPPALKRYWASRRKKKRVIKASKRTRARNPHGLFKLIIRKSGHTLTYDGVKFSSKVRNPPLFSTTAGATHVARKMLRKHPSLRTYQFLAVPHR